MDGFIIFLMFMLFCAYGYVFFRWLNTSDALWHKIFYAPDNMLSYSTPKSIRIWIPVKDENSNSVKIKCRILNTGKEQLIDDLKIVGNHMEEEYYGLNYSGVLASATPEEIKLIAEMRGFLK